MKEIHALNYEKKLLWAVLKNVKHGIEHDIDSTYGDIKLLDIPEIYSKFYEDLAT